MACSSPCRAMSTPSLTRCSHGMAPPCRPPCGRASSARGSREAFSPPTSRHWRPSGGPSYAAVKPRCSPRCARSLRYGGLACIAPGGMSWNFLPGGIARRPSRGARELACPQLRIRVARRAVHSGSPQQASGISGRGPLRSPGPGAAASRTVPGRSGMSTDVGRAVPGCAHAGWWPSRVSS